MCAIFIFTVSRRSIICHAFSDTSHSLEKWPQLLKLVTDAPSVSVGGHVVRVRYSCVLGKVLLHCHSVRDFGCVNVYSINKWGKTPSLRAQELCESRGDRPGLLVPIKLVLILMVSVAVKPVVGECLFAEHTSDSSTNYSSSVLNFYFAKHWYKATLNLKALSKPALVYDILASRRKGAGKRDLGCVFELPRGKGCCAGLQIEDLCGSISSDRGFGPSPFSTKLFNMWVNNTASLCHFSLSLIHSEQHQNGSHRCPPQCRRIILVSDADRPLPLPPGLNFSHQYRGLFGDNSLNSATSQLTKNVPLHYSWVPVPISQDPDLLRQEPLEAVLVLLTRSNWTERRILEGLSWNQVLVGRLIIVSDELPGTRMASILGQS